MSSSATLVEYRKKMLTQQLRELERDGMVRLAVHEDAAELDYR